MTKQISLMQSHFFFLCSEGGRNGGRLGRGDDTGQLPKPKDASCKIFHATKKTEVCSKEPNETPKKQLQ